MIVFIAKMANQFLPFVVNLPEILGAKHGQCIDKPIAAAAAKEIYGLAIQLLNVEWISGFNHNIIDILSAGKKMADFIEMQHLLLELLDHSIRGVGHALDENAAGFGNSPFLVNTDIQ